MSDIECSIELMDSCIKRIQGFINVSKKLNNAGDILYWEYELSKYQVFKQEYQDIQDKYYAKQA